MVGASSQNIESNRVCVRSLISGRVQGVGYRYSTRKKAIALGLVGWVRNLPDGRVEALVVGTPTQVKNMVDWFYIGPPDADVSAVETKEQSSQTFETFKIQR